MRLREIQKVLNDNVSSLNVSGGHIGNQQYQLNNIAAAKTAINNLEQLGLFEKEVSNLKQTNFFSFAGEPLNTTPQEYQTISQNVNTIRQKSEQLLTSLNEALNSKELTHESLSIKISKISTLDDLSDIVEKLKKVIALPLSEYKEGGEVKVANFDSGSFWIDIILPTSSCVLVVGSIAWAGAVIYKKYQEAFAFRQYAATLEIQKDHLKTLQEAAKKKIDLDIEAEAKHIQNEHFNPNDNEQLQRLKLSIREYSELIQKGVEIQPSIVAPEKVTNLFPNYKALALIDSKVKQLSDKNNNSETA